MRWSPRAAVGVFLGLVLMLPATAYAWGPTGHMAVALIAYRKLDSDAKTKVDALMKQHPAYDEFVGKKPKNYPDLEAWVFMMAATWPDQIKSKSNPGHDEFDKDDPKLPRTMLHRGIHDVEHFVDIPFNVDVDGPDPRKDPKAEVDDMVVKLE